MDGSVTKIQNSVKTDLNLLLECLKYQMNCPDSQKQALHTIYSICHQKSEVIDYFREMGGVLFVYNLSKSSKHLEVKEAALFTLGCLAENNVFCQQALCSVDIFTYMTHLVVEDSPLTLKRVVVFMMSVLVTNNKSGQMHAKATGCMDILLDLFRTSFPIPSDDGRPADITQLCQLWTSVSSALCGCVNNPQNEENQLLCMSIFPVAKAWLERFVLPRTEIVQPITSLIGMTVANNPSAQECLASSGALRTLAQSLVRLAPTSHRNPLARDLAVMMTKTISICVTDNAPLASGLAEYHLVPQLLTLLSCPALDPQNRLCIVLAVAHCTESCQEHQSQLLRAGGLPLFIQLLAESQEDELKKAATFVLQTCKQMTSTLGADGASNPPQLDLGDLQERVGPPYDVQSYWRSAWEMEKRINKLEKLQGEILQVTRVLQANGGHGRESGAEGGEDEGERGTANSIDKWRGAAREETLPPAADPAAQFWEGTPVRKARGRGEKRTKAHVGYKGPFESRELTSARATTQPHRHEEREGNTGSRVEFPMGFVSRQLFQATSQRPDPQQSALAGRGTLAAGLEPQQRRRSTSPRPQSGALQLREPAQQGGSVCSVCSRMPLSSTLPAAGGARERDGAGAGSPPTAPPESQVIFRQPYPAKKRTESQNRPSFKDHMSLCSDILESEIRRILQTPAARSKQSSFRCSGCAMGLSPVNSRNFTRILRSCRDRCDRHTVLLEAEDRFKKRVREAIRIKPASDAWEQRRQTRQTPVHKRPSLRRFYTDPQDEAEPGWIALPPAKKPQICKDKSAYHREGATSKKLQEAEHGDEHTRKVSEGTEPVRRERKNFTQDEVQYLLDGVKRLGPKWNCILWSYPFQEGRTNVDLSKKYCHLQKEMEPERGSPEA
ncbi:hypothetical protein AAFF_G00226150 [Aldrovandia affinis]|uniref:Telomere repeats-binding bouquet formation protein 1 n=1 Tax=Aldrovandia affinis TaxID=143900 RepID=A0AAD7TBU6_9TELE|nr:hypothetical protein AAFF_G00226150 [Aldrovandia affinis]